MRGEASGMYDSVKRRMCMNFQKEHQKTGIGAGIVKMIMYDSATKEKIPFT